MERSNHSVHSDSGNYSAATYKASSYQSVHAIGEPFKISPAALKAIAAIAAIATVLVVGFFFGVEIAAITAGAILFLATTALVRSIFFTDKDPKDSSSMKNSIVEVDDENYYSDNDANRTKLPSGGYKTVRNGYPRRIVDTSTHN